MEMIAHELVEIKTFELQILTLRSNVLFIRIAPIVRVFWTQAVRKIEIKMIIIVNRRQSRDS